MVAMGNTNRISFTLSLLQPIYFASEICNLWWSSPSPLWSPIPFILSQLFHAFQEENWPVSNIFFAMAGGLTLNLGAVLTCSRVLGWNPLSAETHRSTNCWGYKWQWLALLTTVNHSNCTVNYRKPNRRISGRNSSGDSRPFSLRPCRRSSRTGESSGGPELPIGPIACPRIGQSSYAKVGIGYKGYPYVYPIIHDYPMIISYWSHQPLLSLSFICSFFWEAQFIHRHFCRLAQGNRERKSWKEKGKGKRTRLRHRRNIRKRRSLLIEVIL